jgi:hypothetical protein
MWHEIVPVTNCVPFLVLIGNLKTLPEWERNGEMVSGPQ